MTQTQRNQVKTDVQNAAYIAWKNAGMKGTIVAATGVGKSKIAIYRVKKIIEETYEPPPLKPSILLVTPTEKLRDENWPEEFLKWNVTQKGMNTFIKRICYASLKNERGNQYRLVILDEIHWLTERNSEGFRDAKSLVKFMSDNMCQEVMGLTATEPDPERDAMKSQIFEQIAPVCFRYTLDQAVDDGLLPEYKVKVIQIPLDRILKVIPAGTKANPFKNTELAAYEYLNKMAMKAQIAKRKNPNSKWAESIYGQRRRFIANLPSKARVAKVLISRLQKENKRFIVFCGGIEISRELCGENVYNSSPEDKPRDMLTAFKNKTISYLGVVDAVNEGHNIPDIDEGIIHLLSSNPRHVIQRLGRILRGENPVMYILVAQGTKDEDWCKEATADLDRKRIVYESYMNYL